MARPPNRLRVLILIGRFDVGGIQRQVMATASGLVERGHHVRVLAVYPLGRFADELAAAGIDVRSLERRSRADLRSLLRGIGQARAFRPHVMYCYHVLPNLLGLVYRPFCRRAKLMWGLRATDIQRHGFVKRTQFRASCRLARLPDAIIANSAAVRAFHEGAGYPRGSIQVIPNGIDTSRFTPDAGQRAAMRRELGLDEQTLAIGVVAQLREKKGHPEFLRALAEARADDKDLVALIVGDGRQRQRLADLASRLGVDDAVRWLGFRDDLPSLYCAMDVLCLPSVFGEGFPNVVGEALACGVPVVATDVGASREIVGAHGAIVAPGDPAELAGALRWAARQRATGALEWPLWDAAERIRREFSTERLIERTEQTMKELIDAA